METDIAIIGGGVVGTAIARELSHYNLQVVLLEKEDDVAMGTSKANSGIIHAGYNAQPGTLKGKLNIEANPLFDQLCEELKVPFKRIGSLVVGFQQADRQRLEQELKNGQQIGVKDLEIIDGDRLFSLEPNLNPKAKFALHAPTAGIISPYELTIALADNAVINGVCVLLETEVLDMIIEDSKVVGLRTNRGNLRAAVVINAAGLYADKIASLVRDDSVNLTPRKGEYHLFDKGWGNYINHVLFPLPGKLSKGILVTPTVHGNLMIGPNSYPVTKKDDLSTSRVGLNEVYEEAKRLVPGIDRSGVIASFSGLRAAAVGEDFIIGPVEGVRGLVHAAGIQSPGLTSAPAIAKSVVDIVKEQNTELVFTLKDDFQAELPERKTLAENKRQDWQEVVKENPDFGEVICRCEQVTRGEIVAAINSPVPATSLDAIKRRTRTGAGRCQGGFCSPRVLEILAEELNISPFEVSKKGPGSEILLSKTKDLILKAGETDDTKL